MKYATVEQMRQQLLGAWVEVERDLSASVIATMLLTDGHVAVIYDDRRFAIVRSVGGAR